MRKSVIFWKSLIGGLAFIFFGTACDSVSEDPQPYLRIDEMDKTVILAATQGVSRTIAIDVNTSEWTVDVSDEGNGKDWLSAIQGNGNIIISTLKKNESDANRSTQVIVSLKNGSESVVINVTQLGDAEAFLQTDITEKAFSASGGSVIVTVTATNMPEGEWNYTLSDQTAGWLRAEKTSNNQLAITVDKNLGSTARSAEITITSLHIIPAQQPKVLITQAAPSVGTNFSITGYESQIITVTFTDETTSELILDDAGYGTLPLSGGSPRTIKSIQAEGGDVIKIGRKESVTDEIVLSIGRFNALQWRTKDDDGLTPLINTAAELLNKFNYILPEGITGTVTYLFESDIDLMDELLTTPLSGTLTQSIDGNHHTIYGVNVELDYTGMAYGRSGGFIAGSFGGVLRNLHIAVGGKVHVTGNTNSQFINGVGTFVGTLTGKIIGCSNAATVTGNLNVGGICGVVSGDFAEVIACANYGNITSETIGAGGICLSLYMGSIKACYNTGAITTLTPSGTSQSCAGIAPRFDTQTSISACYNTGTITSVNQTTMTSIGSINGSNSGSNTMEDCFYSGNSYTTAGTSNALTAGNGAQVFSASAWPTNNAEKNWGIGTPSGDGLGGTYWSSVGNSPSSYPKLYWEPLIK
ncbi:MAG: hypothetical protein EZS26_003585 [Candidatus Ordinivivax streblomastigis]|uniref:BACON domain-containing protein n=1 Tax=Candidatus Ordinivivax streblomastigis TaxID=2540710 RepID=A0A5M8NXJ0_9BACT|nr:MAG: hypothetical protein EZS26_003585 [Candidatus Ordinivivax streblomastigis]